MNLLFLTTSYPRFAGDEASIFVARLAENLRNLVSNLTVIVPLDKDEPATEVIDSIGGRITIARFQYRGGTDQGLAFGAGLVPNLKARPWQVWQLATLVVQMYKKAKSFITSDTVMIANWILAGVVARMLHSRNQVPYIYIVRGLEMKVAKTVVGRVLFNFVIKNSKSTVCVSLTFQEELRSIFPNYAQKIISISNGVSPEVPTPHDILIFEETHGLKVARPYLLMVGTVVPRKNLEAAIELMASGLANTYDLRVLGRLNDTRYVEKLQAMAEQRGIKKSLILHGEVSPTDVPLFMACARGFIASSTHEGMPNSLLEALALGKLVCVSDIPAHREVISPGHNGLIFSLDTPGEIAPRLLGLLENEEERRVIEQNAQAAVHSRTWEACALKYMEAIRSL